MYPLPKEGQERIIIELPKKKKEQNLKVEILIGKMAETNACNSYFLMGELKEQDVMGWGYTYYEFLSEGYVGSTLMLCPEDETTLEFVSAEGVLIDYHSKLPTVVYIPEGVEVKNTEYGRQKINGNHLLIK